MAIPHDDDIIHELLLLLSNAPNGTMRCNDIYFQLAKRFSGLTTDELQTPYRNSKNKWANRVQFARLYCVEDGLILPRKEGAGHGSWTISKKGRALVAGKT